MLIWQIVRERQSANGWQSAIGRVPKAECHQRQSATKGRVPPKAECHQPVSVSELAQISNSIFRTGMKAQPV